MFQLLKEKNNHFPLHNVLCRSQCFKTYGRVIENIDFSSLITVASEETKVPDTGNIYEASADVLENIKDIKDIISQEIYGELDIQIGYCNGNNSKLNALEWHNGNEVVIAVTDLVLLLAHTWDIVDGCLPSDKVEGFFVPSNTAVEIFSSTMHLAPCKTSDEGFKSIIILPLHTNFALEHSLRNSSMLYKKNKWLIAHKENTSLLEAGVKANLLGENIEVFY